MYVLVDTGILLRFFDRSSPDHSPVRRALRTIKKLGNELAAAPQIIAEFWNVCTRPNSVRGGYDLSSPETFRRVRVVERILEVLPEPASAYDLWKLLIVNCQVRGKQVHDARLVAFMRAHGFDHILTLNPTDFQRLPGITILTPAMLMAMP